MLSINNPIPDINLGVTHIAHILIPTPIHLFQLLPISVRIAQHFRVTIMISYISLVSFLSLSVAVDKLLLGF